MSAADAAQVLTGLRVLDLSRWVAGEFATKLFADFGADVVKIEKPGEGSHTRRWGPFPGDVPHPERSALFLHLNTNKRSVTLDLATATGRERLLALVADADLVVESFRPGALERFGLGPDVLAAANPRAVLTRISAFGQTGPHRDREATGLTLQAAGWPMNATGAADRPPHRKPGLLEHYTIGRMAAHASLAALTARRRTGVGSVVDVSGQETLLAGADRQASHLMTAAYSGVDAPRGVRSAHRGAATFTGAYPCRDGFVMIYVTNAAFWDRFVEMIADGDAAFVEAYRGRWNARGAGEEWDRFDAHARSWFAARGKREIMVCGQGRRIPLTAFLEVGELLADDHFRARGCFVAGEHPDAGRLDYVGPPWRMAGGWRLRRTAPRLGADTDDVLAELGAARPATAPDSVPTPAAPAVLPLAGIRVVDLTVVWSGPGATTLLGDLGAEVVRVEDPDRMSRQASARTTRDNLTGSPFHRMTYPKGDPGERPYDRSAVFNWHARNKLSATMALGTPEGQEAFRALIACSDVLVENNSARVLGNLGIDADTLLAINPQLVVVRMPPLGLDGPMSGYLGYGPNVNALLGIQAMDGYEGEDPTTAGDNYHMDESAPAGAAFAVLAALWERERTGRGQMIEFSQAENVLAEIGEHVLDHQVNGREPSVLGNTDPHILQDVVPTAAPDRWVAISVRHDADWAALTGVLDAGPWAHEGATADRRRENSAALRRALAAATAGRDAAELVEALQRAGVAAGEVMTPTRLLADPHLEARGWFRTRTHPAVGTHRYPGHPWRAEGLELAWGRPLPGFGEDNEYVYRTVLGYSEKDYDALVTAGHVTDRQRA